MPPPKVLAFDLFGTVVDWRTGVARAADVILGPLIPGFDAPAFADAWRRRYQPAMEEVRSGRRPFVRLDDLHRETLEALLPTLGIDPATLGEARVVDLSHAWRRLPPWPDAVAGLARLRTRRPVVTLSNANIALALEMARFGGLTWDAILGAEVTGAYKPLPAAYLGTADLLGIAPGELCLVAAHHSDLAAARAAGLMTAYVDRPLEYGGQPAPDRDARQEWEFSVASLTELAERLVA